MRFNKIFRTLGRLVAAASILTATTFSASSFAALSEIYSATKIPVEVVFKREVVGAFQTPLVNRYERYVGGVLERSDYKNAEYSEGNGPAHARNHTLGAKPDGTMWMIFKLRTEGYFNSGVANHIPILLRGELDRSIGHTGGTQTGRGLSLFSPSYGGLTVENFGAKTYALADVPDGKLQLRDGTAYWFLIHTTEIGISYSVFSENGQLLVKGYWQDKNPVAGSGYGFAVLCNNDENANCDFPWGSAHYGQQFEVRFSDISVGWF